MTPARRSSSSSSLVAARGPLAARVSALASVGAERAPRRRPAQAVVVRVVDGDTVVLRLPGGEETVRLIGIDTPETVKPDTPGRSASGPRPRPTPTSCCPTAPACASPATSRPATTSGGCSLYVWRADDDRFVNLDLAAGGFAPAAVDRAQHRPPSATFAAAADEARRRRAGPVGSAAGAAVITPVASPVTSWRGHARRTPRLPGRRPAAHHQLRRPRVVATPPTPACTTRSATAWPPAPR